MVAIQELLAQCFVKYVESLSFPVIKVLIDIASSSNEQENPTSLGRSQFCETEPIVQNFMRLSSVHVRSDSTPRHCSLVVMASLVLKLRSLCSCAQC